MLPANANVTLTDKITHVIWDNGVSYISFSTVLRNI